MLSPMPLAITLGAGAAATPWAAAAIENINGQAITLGMQHEERRDPRGWKGLRFAVPFDYSMHNYLLRYYLAEAGLDPDQDVQIRLLSRELWAGHPCCAFAASGDFIKEAPNTFQALLHAVVDATAFAAKPENRKQIAETIAPTNYLKLVGAGASAGGTGLPSPGEVGGVILGHLSHPFFDKGSNNKGIGIQLAYSLARVLIGFGLAALVAVPLGFVIGMSPLMYRALDPFIQVLKPVSPLAWMPLALYTISDSVLSSVFVIFICSIWPMLINTAFGVASTRREWLDVARTLEVGLWRRIFLVVLPAAAPTIMTEMRISIGIAWLVIVAAEMLVGGTSIGYFVWNEWNNLSLSNVITAILAIGLVGMLLDRGLAGLARLVHYAE